VPDLRTLRRVVITGCMAAALSPVAGSEDRPRARDLGLEPGVLQPGPLNAITDVAGVRVGQRTLIEGAGVRTGVTAVVPHGGNIFQSKVPAAVWPANAFGKAAGFLQVQELGNLETPIVLTNTLCVGTAVQTVVDWTLQQPGNEEVRSVNAVVGEKIVAQGVPIIGALGGATINVLFIDHFQDMARGHFIVRRLERSYGEDEVRAKYERLRSLRG